MKTFRYRVSRMGRARILLLSRLFRSAPFDFHRNPRLIAVVGDYIGDQIRARGRYEDDFLRLLESEILPACRPGTALDIGANIGNHTLFLARHFANVIAFEPNPATRHLLEFNLALNSVENVIVRPIGLSDRSGSGSLYVDAGNLGASRIVAPRDKSATGTEGQIVISLAVGDEEIEPDCDIAFIKLDVEGHEHEALRGLRQTIDRCKPIIMLEQLVDAIDASSGSSPAQTLLVEMGYKGFEIRAVPALGSNVVRYVAEIITGTVAQQMVPLERLEARNYPALLFMPPGR
jgi:FkbM family methyltransferase